MGDDADAREYFNSIRDAAAGVRNLDFKGFLPLDETELYFDEARVFVNTSEHEGFPNTFLQAWARGMPTVSYFDAGTAMDDARPFQWVSSEDGAVEAVRLLMTDDVAWNTLSSRCKRHFNAKHSTRGVVDRYITLFHDLGMEPRG